MANHKGKKATPRGATGRVNYDKEARRKKKAHQKQNASQVRTQASRTPTGPVEATPPTRPQETAGPKTQSQQRAAFALQRVKAALEGLNQSSKKELKSHASAFPAMIQMNGLGQAAAFYLSKGGVHKELYQILGDWLTSGDRPYARHGDLLDGITGGDLAGYLTAQAEALALLDWVKRFANAFVRED